MNLRSLMPLSREECERAWEAGDDFELVDDKGYLSKSDAPRNDVVEVSIDHGDAKPLVLNLIGGNWV